MGGNLQLSHDSGFPSLGCTRLIRRSEGVDVKRGSYRRRLAVCYRALFGRRRRVKTKIALALTAAVLLNLPWPVHAQMPPGPYPGPPPGPGYPSPGYPQAPSGYGEAQWAQCQQLEQAEREIAGRLQFTPPGP